MGSMDKYGLGYFDAEYFWEVFEKLTYPLSYDVVMLSIVK